MSKPDENHDYLYKVVGGGVIGLWISRDLVIGVGD